MPYQVGLLFATRDSELQEEFTAHLFPYKREKFLELVEEVTEKELGSLDILVAGISPSFLANEVAMGLWEKAVARGIRCVPFILRPCAWQVLPGVAKFEPLPKDGKPVTTWANRDEALLSAAQLLRKVKHID